jgi:hypothetical protein
MRIFKKQLSLKQYLTFFAAFIFISLTTLIGGEKIYLELKLYNQSSQISLLEQVNLDLKQQETKLNTLIVQQNSIINNLNLSKSKLDLEFSKVSEETKAIEANLASLLEVSQELEKEITELNKKLVSNLIIDSQTQEARTLNDLDLDYDALIAETRTRIGFYQQEIIAYTSLNQIITNSNNQLLLFINDLNLTISEKETEYDNLLVEIDELNEIIEALNQEIFDEENFILSFDLESLDAGQEKDELVSLFDDYQERLLDKSNLIDQIDEKLIEKDSLIEARESLQLQYDDLLAANELLASSIDLLQEQIDEQVSHIALLDQQITQANNDILNLELFVANTAFNVSLNDINYVSQVSVKANVMIKLSTLISDARYGSGIVIDVKPGSSSELNRFYILTNFETVAEHIIDSIPIYVYNYFFNRYDEGSVIFNDDKFALILVEAPINTFIAIPLASANYQVNVSELVFSLSSQAHHINALRVGRVETKLVEGENDLDIFTHNAFLIGQNLRGGAILNQDYEIIGFNFYTLTNKAYSIIEISEFLLLAVGVD